MRPHPWQTGQDAKDADWLIGPSIIGPEAKKRGFTCLRDMNDPGAAHCLAPQPTHYSQIRPGMDPHYTSGPPNRAFCLAAKLMGGKSWETVGQVWYQVLTGSGARPNMTMQEFAHSTRTVAAQMFTANPAVHAAVDQAWKHVGL